MKLYYFETPNPRKPCAVAKYLSAPVDLVRIDLAAGEHKTPAFLAVNPNAKVPALTDGDTRLWESHAIMCYLADKAGSDLWPKDARQIDIIRWLNWDTAHFSRHGGALLYQNYIKPHFGMGAPDPAAVEEATGFFKQFAAVLDAHLDGRTYLVGESLSVADFGVACMLPSADVAKLPLDGFPQIQRWHAALEEIPAWREPFPSASAKTA